MKTEAEIRKKLAEIENGIDTNDKADINQSVIYETLVEWRDCLKWVLAK